MEVSCTGPMDEVEKNLIPSFPDFQFSVQENGVIRVEADASIAVGPLARLLEDHGVEVFETRKMRPSLEDIFVSTTGIKAGAMRKEKEKKGGKSRCSNGLPSGTY